jgi:hypothetical protein
VPAACVLSSMCAQQRVCSAACLSAASAMAAMLPQLSRVLPCQLTTAAVQYLVIGQIGVLQVGEPPDTVWLLLLVGKAARGYFETALPPVCSP